MLADRRRHLRPRAKSLPILLGELTSEHDRVVAEAEQQGEIESLRVGHVIDIDGNGFADEGTKQRGSGTSP